jgi:hypothetical protein
MDFLRVAQKVDSCDFGTRKIFLKMTPIWVILYGRIDGAIFASIYTFRFPDSRARKRFQASGMRTINWSKNHKSALVCVTLYKRKIKTIRHHERIQNCKTFVRKDENKIKIKRPTGNAPTKPLISQEAIYVKPTPKPRKFFNVSSKTQYGTSHSFSLDIA